MPVESVNALSENDTVSVSGSESKKRSKLGYHRTAVACGHCRRRKIRCIPAANPTETRCQNCIRLKKECLFTPVEGNGTAARKFRSHSKAELSEEDLTTVKSTPSTSTTTMPGSFDSTLVESEPSSGNWSDLADAVTSPAEHNDNVQHWNPNWRGTQGQHQMQNFYGYTSLDAANNYWPGQDQSSSSVQAQQFAQATTNAPFLQGMSSSLSGQQFHDNRSGTGRQSSSSMPMTASGFQPPYPFQNYPASFPELERSMEMPSMYGQSQDGVDMNMQINNHMNMAAAHYDYDQGYSLQQTPHSAGWHPPPSTLQELSANYLPFQPESQQRNSQYPS